LLAVLPQFVIPTRPLLPQYLTIAATVTVVDVIVMCGCTGLVGASTLRPDPDFFGGDALGAESTGRMGGCALRTTPTTRPACP
jgi:hypothetical protein